MSNDTVIGIVLLARHGDREGFYQDPHTYTASATAITPLGTVNTPQRHVIFFINVFVRLGTRVPTGLTPAFSLP